MHIPSPKKFNPYSAKGGNEIRALIMDYLTALAASVMLWCLFGGVAIAAHRTNITGIYASEVLKLQMAACATMTLPCSWLTLLALGRFKFRTQREHRSKGFTALAIVLATGITTASGSLLFGHNLDPFNLLVALLSFGLTAVPASVRLTHPKAFAKPEHFRNKAQDHHWFHVTPDHNPDEPLN